jgi:hypothetical protein
MGKLSRGLAETHDVHVSLDLHEQLYSDFVKQREIQSVLKKVGTQSRLAPIKGSTEIIK